MGKTQRKSASAEPTHDEIWDDSALLNSWNLAIEEYKKYHSLHAKGITVARALDRYDVAESSNSNQPLNDVFTSAEHGAVDEDHEMETKHEKIGCIPNALPSDAGYGPENLQGHSECSETDQLPTASRNNVKQAAAALSSIPNVLFNGAASSIQDPGLKNLMMSWYYAGYYTGLHEGEQRALSQAQDSQPASATQD